MDSDNLNSKDRQHIINVAEIADNFCMSNKFIRHILMKCVEMAKQGVYIFTLNFAFNALAFQKYNEEMKYEKEGSKELLLNKGKKLENIFLSDAFGDAVAFTEQELDFFKHAVLLPFFARHGLTYDIYDLYIHRVFGVSIKIDIKKAKFCVNTETNEIILNH